MNRPVYFVHISDTHVHPNRDFEVHGRVPYRNAELLVGALKGLPTQPDFIVHTGDVTNDGQPEAYALVEQLLGNLGVPVYYAVGNHDDPDQVRTLAMGERTAVADSLVSYAFESAGERFIVLHSQGPREEIGGSGRLTEEQLAFLNEQIESTDERLTLFLHHCPMHLDCDWHDDRIDLLNGDDLHEALVPHRDRIRGVFFGHIHRGVQIIKDGIHYASVGSPYMPLHLWPEGEADRDIDAPLPFNFVTLTDHSTIVKEHTVSIK